MKLEREREPKKQKEKKKERETQRVQQGLTYNAAKFAYFSQKKITKKEKKKNQNRRYEGIYIYITREATAEDQRAKVFYRGTVTHSKKTTSYSCCSLRTKWH